MREIGDLKVLDAEELKQILLLPNDLKKNYLIAGYVDFTNQHIMCFRGSGMSFIIPFSCFKPSASVKADFDHLEFIDYGQTVKLGDYEASVDAILYELDEGYRYEVDNKTKGATDGTRNREKISN